LDPEALLLICLIAKAIVVGCSERRHYLLLAGKPELPDWRF